MLYTGGLVSSSVVETARHARRAAPRSPRQNGRAPPVRTAGPTSSCRFLVNREPGGRFKLNSGDGPSSPSDVVSLAWAEMPPQYHGLPSFEFVRFVFTAKSTQAAFGRVDVDGAVIGDEDRDLRRRWKLRHSGG